MLMSNYLSTAVQLKRVLNATVAGTTAVNTTSVDLQNKDGCRFIVAFGTLTATQVTSVKLQGSNDNTNWLDLLDVDSGTVITTGNLADADSNKVVSLEVYKCKRRYVRAVISRGTANAVIDGAWGELVLRNALPMALDATQAKTAIMSGYSYTT